MVGGKRHARGERGVKTGAPASLRGRLLGASFRADSSAAFCSGVRFALRIQANPASAERQRHERTNLFSTKVDQRTCERHELDAYLRKPLPEWLTVPRCYDVRTAIPLQT
jgi:hypothetical protein